MYDTCSILTKLKTVILVRLKMMTF